MTKVEKVGNFYSRNWRHGKVKKYQIYNQTIHQQPQFLKISDLNLIKINNKCFRSFMLQLTKVLQTQQRFTSQN
eukprot:403365483